MRRVVLLVQAAEDLEDAKSFYNKKEAGVGEYCVTSLLADVQSLALYHGIHARHFNCLRMLGSRFPFGIYYVEAQEETRVVAILDLRRHPNWIRRRLRGRL